MGFLLSVNFVLDRKFEIKPTMNETSSTSVVQYLSNSSSEVNSDLRLIREAIRDIRSLPEAYGEEISSFYKDDKKRCPPRYPDLFRDLRFNNIYWQESGLNIAESFKLVFSLF